MSALCQGKRKKKTKSKLFETLRCFESYIHDDVTCLVGLFRSKALKEWANNSVKGFLVEEGLLKNKIGFQKTSIGTCLICFVFESKTELCHKTCVA